MKKLALYIFIVGIILFAGASNLVLNAQTVINNGLIRFGTGSENSINSQGLLQQPFYYNGTSSNWYKLTYSSYPLDMAIGVGGDGTSEWNMNGAIANTQGSWILTNQVIDDSNFNADGTVPEYGTIISTGEMTIGGINFEVQNTYKLPEDKGYIEITSKIKNIDTQNATNVRIWVGTRDDYVGTNDGPTKVKGNIVDGEFVQISNQTDRSTALKIYSGNEAVLFYSTSPTGNTSINSCCSFSNAMNQDPSASMITRTGDGSYCYYMRLSDLAPDESDEVVWYYAAGSLADIADIIQDVADASGAVSNISYASADFNATVTADATGYYIVIPRDATAPTEAQIKAGVDYGSVTVAANGSSAMLADVGKTFNLTGLVANTEYDLYFVSEDNVPQYSDILKVQFSTIAYTVPDLTTISATSITGNSANSGGNITDNGGQSVTLRGVCWDTTGSPTTNDSKTENGSGTGSFTGSISGLSSGTTYYVRAYAINSVGTGYGDVVSFTTLPNVAPVAKNDTFYVNTGGTVIGNLLDNDTDEDVDDLDVNSEPLPTHGSFNSFNVETGEFEYLAPISWIGTFTFSYSINDGTASHNAKITIVINDTIAPVLLVKPIERVLRENGIYVLTAGDTRELSSGTTDNYSSEDDLKLEAFPRFFDCSHAGIATPVQITATDVNGNSSFAWTTVTIHDTISPVANCKDVELFLDENGDATLLPEMINAGPVEETPLWWGQTFNDSKFGSYDACGIESVSIDRESFECSDIGVTLVKLTVSDPNGNVSTCTAEVTITDTTPPVFEAVDDITIKLSAGDCETEIGYPVITVADNCGNYTLELIEGLGNDGSFPIGVTIETWKATDEQGNTSEISFSVTVSAANDDPAIGKIPDITVEENTEMVRVPLSGISYGKDCIAQSVTISAMSSNPELIDSVKIDYVDGNVKGSLFVFITPESTGEAFITVTIEDSEGASSSDSFNIIVKKPCHPPYIVTPVPDQFVTAGQALTLPLSNISGILFGDAVDAELELELTLKDGGELPEWIMYSNDTLNCLPALSDTGCIELVIYATDALGAVARDTFNVFVEKSITVNINEQLTSSFEVNMYPNPTNSQVHLKFSGLPKSEVNLSVINITGEVVFRKTYKQTNRILFDISENVSGVYLIILKSGGKEVVKKLILDK